MNIHEVNDDKRVGLGIQPELYYILINIARRKVVQSLS